MKIKNTAIIGAGAVGSYFIAGLQEKLGENLWIVAEGERRNRLLKEGILINEKKIDLNIKTAAHKNFGLFLNFLGKGSLSFLCYFPFCYE